MIAALDDYLQKQMSALPGDSVSRAMEYSLMASGKRVRPLLLFAVMEGYKTDWKKGLPAAAAIEMVHTYSLIHDDLPAMDNDDLRRGKPTCHKAFGEAQAILAGDALLTMAFDQMADSPADPEEVIALVKLLSSYSGIEGMVLGQSYDLAFEEREVKPEELLEMQALKTGKLLQLPLLCGAVLSGHKEDFDLWTEIGKWIGIQFQIKDDLLEIEDSDMQKFKSLSDSRNHKSTAISILGVENARSLMDEGDRIIDHHLALLQEKGFDPKALDDLRAKLSKRRH